MSSQSETIEEGRTLQEKFKQYDISSTIKDEYPESLYPPLKRSSVLVPIFFRAGKWRVLLTVRSTNLKNHSGSVAFPGGVKDESDADVTITALREAEEEIGLSRHDVTVLAVFPPFLVRPGNIVFSVVAHVNRTFVPKINKDEVSSIFDLPLETFVNCTDVQSWRMFGTDFNIFYFPTVVDNVATSVWGFTATVCMAAALIVFDIKKRLRILKQSTASDDDIFGDFKPSFHLLCQNVVSHL